MALRQQILDASLQLFFRQGFHASGVDKLAQEAGVTKRTLYAHFGSKDGLIEAVLSHRHAQFMALLENYVAQHADAPFAQTYLNFIDEWTRAPDFYGCLFINACAEYQAQADVARQTSQAHKHALQEWLTQRLEPVFVQEAAVYANMLFVFGEGLIVAAQAGQARRPESLRLFLTLFE